MTTSGKGVAATEADQRAAYCAFCLRRLGDEFYFTCRGCRRAYCYVHMSRHLARACRRRREPRLEQPIPTPRAGA